MDITTVRTHYGLEFAAYPVSFWLVESVDNQGEPCEYCDVDYAVVDVSIHGMGHLGYAWSADCCEKCMPRLVVDHCDASYNVIVTTPDVEFDNGLMSGPNDVRLHPEAC